MRLQLLVVVALLAGSGLSLAASAWHHNLYLGNDGYWRGRIEVTVHNDMEREARGEPVEVPIGAGDGAANLVGALVDAIRVCDPQGVEMLYSVMGARGEQVTRGPVADDSRIVIPVECPAGGTATYYIYFDNPAAWAVPDFLDSSTGVRNGDLELGEGEAPDGWRHDANDPQHQTFWVTENPRSGKRCLKTVVAEGAEETWIATRQGGIRITGGARYRMRAWVKAENVKGYAGWYIHVGNADNYMIIGPMLSGGGGTYDWKEVTAEFTAPPEANLSDLGTVLRGTGTAWFDDVSLECLDPAKLTATAGPVQRLELQEVGLDAPWYDDDPGDDIYWEWRAAVRLVNATDVPQEPALTAVNIAGLLARLHGKVNEHSLRVTEDGRLIPHFRAGDLLVFEGEAPARTRKTYWIYLSADHRIPQTSTSDYAGMVDSPHNLARNPSFEQGDEIPAAWAGGAEGERPAGAALGLDEPGLFGARCARMSIPHDAALAWTGWRQNVPVEPGKTYLFSAWVKCQDVRNGYVQLHAHYRNAQGELCKDRQYTGTGPAINGTTDWTLMSGLFDMPQDIAFFQLHLTMLATGTVWHDGVVLAEARPGKVGKIEAAPSPPAPVSAAAQGAARQDMPRAHGLTVWPVNAVVKVFQDDVPPREVPPARISAAGNEYDPLQLALRAGEEIKQVRVEVEPPRNGQGATLTEVEVGVVGYVPIDHETNYYSSTSPAWHRKYPTTAGACDGWPGMWPDPLIPRETFDLAANTTQPVWVTVKVPAGAAPGDYQGTVKFIRESAVLAEMPFIVHVWGFDLPQERHVKAIYDTRQGGGMWRIPGKSEQETRELFWRFMAERRVCPDTIKPEPDLRYENGQVTADFTHFDRAAEYYFDVLKMPHAYTPWYFYCFGWGHLPGERFGEAPYEGAYPYEGADRGKLRPEFKQAYQACLRVYWDHLKARGWDKKVVLYISDEPYDANPDIRAQMKALCDMIHEVDPAIPIYCSTWHHQPEWDGYLNVWGLGHYGIVSVEKMEELRDRGARIWWTTDGQMCTDTPYCAVERLLPHYCFKYGVEAYEFWGIDWLTYDPYQFGWHAYLEHHFSPGDKPTWVRYPNGDGFLAYPPGPLGLDRPVSSVRLEQAREGCEDYEYLYLLRELVTRAKAAGRDTSEAEAALNLASNLVDIPNAGGRYSTKILPRPDAVLQVKEAVARAVESLLR